MKDDGSRLERSLCRAYDLLEKFEFKAALVGGLAVSARTEPRFTRDIDFAVAVNSDQEAESVVHFMLGNRYQTAFDIEQTRTGRLSTMRLVHPESPGVFVDLLFASSGIEPEIVRDADKLDVFGRGVRVAPVSHLLATKLLSQSDARLQDRQDLALLFKVATVQDRKLTRKLVQLIESRGYHRSKDLLHELAELERNQGS